ncbi:MAG: hypothetical protein WC224_03270 [Sphaerochaetaceae bacterium]
MRRLLVILLLVLLFIGNLGAAWYSIQYSANNLWLNNDTTQIFWTGNEPTGWMTGYVGINYQDGNPPGGLASPPNPRNLTMVISSEPHLSELRVTKLGDPTKYFRAFLTNPILNDGQTITNANNYEIPINLGGWFLGGNFAFGVKSNAPLFSSDEGFDGIYRTYVRIRLYPTSKLYDKDYLLLDEVIPYSLFYAYTTGAEVASLGVVPYVSEVDIPYMQTPGRELTVGSVEIVSNWGEGSPGRYSVKISPGEGSTFAFKRSVSGESIPYKVKIKGTGVPASTSAITRSVTTKNSQGHWYDYFELDISGFTPSVNYRAGHYESIIRVELFSN